MKNVFSPALDIRFGCCMLYKSEHYDSLRPEISLQIFRICFLKCPYENLFLPFFYLRRVTSVENRASHPLASALVSYARLKGVEPSEDVDDFEVIAGEGVSAVVDGHTVQIGNARMAARFGWDTGTLIHKDSMA